MNTIKNPGEIIISFGKTHKGKSLKDCPRDYVQWLSEQSTICGKTDIPQAAAALLATLPPEEERPLRYAIPTTLEEAEKLSWMVEKWENREAKRTLLAARDAKTHCFLVEVEDGDMGYFKVFDSGMGAFIGSLEEIAQEEKEEEEQAERMAQWEANPALDWVASNGKHIQVWAHDEFGDEDGYEDEKGEWVVLYIVKIDGVKHTYEIADVPAKHRATAKQKGIVACLGPVGLTQERLSTLLGSVKATEQHQGEEYSDVCPRCRQTSCNGYDCRG